jgi:hypothetical protein
MRSISRLNCGGWWKAGHRSVWSICGAERTQKLTIAGKATDSGERLNQADFVVYSF